MNDIAQQNLREPERLDWDTAFQSSKYQAPPPASGPDGKPITYYGKVAEIKQSDPDDGYLNYQIDFTLVNAGSHDGTRVRTWASTRPFQRRDKVSGELVPVKGNPNALGKFLKSAGLTAKPQTNSDYQAALKQINGRSVGFTLDWEARNKETGEKVFGYVNFPNDEAGQKKPILRAGDIVTERDREGNITGTKTVESEILFANARLKYFVDATPKPVR